MSKSEKRRQAKLQKKRKKVINSVIWGSVFVAVIGVVGIFIVQAAQPLPGETIPVMEDTRHVAEGSNPGPYNSNPPSSGRHYAEDLLEGFYDENEYIYPEGYLVHNLEHGYVIFWYNCEILQEDDCAVLKTQIKEAMDEFNGKKLIAYPWPAIDTPVAMTSWGKLQQFEQFDPEQAVTFIKKNRNKAPEPNMP